MKEQSNMAQEMFKKLKVKSMDKLPNEYLTAKDDELKTIKSLFNQQIKSQELIVEQLDTIIKTCLVIAKSITTSTFAISFIISLFYVMTVLWGTQ